MKSILLFVAVAGLFASGSAFARPNNRSCNSNDYSRITEALSSPVQSGEQLRSEVQGMLAEEMGPICKDVTSDGAGIPGNVATSYLLSSGDRSFEVTIVIGGVEEPGTHVYIEQK